LESINDWLGGTMGLRSIAVPIDAPSRVGELLMIALLMDVSRRPGTRQNRLTRARLCLGRSWRTIRLAPTSKINARFNKLGDDNHEIEN